MAAWMSQAPDSADPQRSKETIAEILRAYDGTPRGDGRLLCVTALRELDVCYPERERLIAAQVD